MHGLAGWFDINFLGTDKSFVLTTAPDLPGTHWYQCRLLFREPLAINRGQEVHGTLHFVANDKFSYDISMKANIAGTTVQTENLIHLHDQVSVVA